MRKTKMREINFRKQSLDKLGQSIQEWTSNICGRQPLKKFTIPILEYFECLNPSRSEKRRKT